MIPSRFRWWSNDGSSCILSNVCLFFERKQFLLLVISIISMVLLFVIHSATTAMYPDPSSSFQKFVVVITISLLLLIGCSIFSKGIVPIVICTLGLILSYAGVLYPSYIMDMVGEVYYKSSYGFTSEKSVLNASYGYFYLGISMIVFSIIVGHKPSLLYTKNRPEPSDIIWKKYPVWKDNTKVIGGYPEPSVPLRSLMTTEENYLLWRYEFVLTNIYGTPHLVKPDGFVPSRSTILRDKTNLSMIGKAKYNGYFV
jgi:hypothetical protein